ncbi:HAD family hydrolase [Haloplanus sp. C73]|uniref:HAD family hydrolase n=1 Tax=Haloplanus sp. C73 TaxID=3421641 RepID=UPI003EC14E4C
MLLAFDFEGTLAASDPYIRLGEQHGTGDEIAALLDRMATGDLDYEEGLRTVASHLEGLEIADGKAALDDLRIRDDASALLAALHESDHHVAVVTDAPEWAVASCLDHVSFDVDDAITTHLPTEKGALTGDIEGSLLESGKAAELERLATEAGYSLGDTIAVGGDQRDLPMLQAAGTGVGVDPVPVVEREADLVVPSMSRLHDRLEARNVV